VGGAPDLQRVAFHMRAYLVLRPMASPIVGVLRISLLTSLVVKWNILVTTNSRNYWAVGLVKFYGYKPVALFCCVSKQWLKFHLTSLGYFWWCSMYSIFLFLLLNQTCYIIFVCNIWFSCCDMSSLVSNVSIFSNFFICNNVFYFFSSSLFVSNIYTFSNLLFMIYVELFSKGVYYFLIC